jgi:hypothetical protein
MTMKFATDRPFADPEKAAGKLMQIADATEAVQEMAASISSAPTSRFSKRADRRIRRWHRARNRERLAMAP